MVESVFESQCATCKTFYLLEDEDYILIFLFLICSTVTKSKLTLLTTQQTNKSGDEMLRQGTVTLFGKLEDQEDGRLVSPKPSYQGLDASFFYRTESGRR